MTEEMGDDTLISGFLSALNSFATIERGEEIKSLKLKETTLIFEKEEGFLQELVFVITTKSDEMITLLHDLLHDIMTRFTEIFVDALNKQFDGDVSEYKNFNPIMEELLKAYGLDKLNEYKKIIDYEGSIKAMIFIKPKEGTILYIYAKQYLDRKKISFLTPLVHTSSNVFFKESFNDDIHHILIRTIKNDGLAIESRKKVLITTLYKFKVDFEDIFNSHTSSPKKLEKYVKKPAKLNDIFEKIDWNSAIKEFYVINPLGKELYHKAFLESTTNGIHFPEFISVLTSSEKLSEQLFNRDLLFFTTIGKTSYNLTCINFKLFYLLFNCFFEETQKFEFISSCCIDLLTKIQF